MATSAVQAWRQYEGEPTGGLTCRCAGNQFPRPPPLPPPAPLTCGGQLVYYLSSRPHVMLTDAKTSNGASVFLTQ